MDVERKNKLIKDINNVISQHYDNYISYSKQNLKKKFKENENSHIDLVHYVIISTIDRATKNEDNLTKFEKMIEENKLHYYILTAVINNSKILTYPFIREFIRENKKKEYFDNTLIDSDADVFNNNNNSINEEDNLQQIKIEKVNNALKQLEKTQDLIDLLMFKVYMYNEITYAEIGQIFNTTKSQAFIKINKIKTNIQNIIL